MIAKLLPLIFLLAGTGGGIGAGIFLTGKAGAPDAAPPPVSGDEHASGTDADTPKTEFVKMNNQFVIPVIEQSSIAALVVLSLSLEARAGMRERIYDREPKLRDSFLQVLFDHANMGGFQGVFTETDNLNLLRTALREVAQKELGPDLLDVLIVELVRQDT